MVRLGDMMEDLFAAIVVTQDVWTPEQQAGIVTYLRQKGHDVSWNSISDTQVTMPPSLPVTWDLDAHMDVLQAMNLHFKPNAESCRQMIGYLRAKGHTFSDNALLPMGADYDAMTKMLCDQHGYHFTSNAFQYVIRSHMKSNPKIKIKMPANVTIWNHDAHVALLQAIFAKAAPTAAEWPAVQDYLNERGYDYSLSAAQMEWDHQADHDLLACITIEQPLTQEVIRSVQAKMTELGYLCSVKAITQHLQKLRRKEIAGGAAGTGDESASAAPKTPRKRAPAAKKTPASKRKTPKSEPMIIDDDSEDMETPTKKVKREMKSEPGVKKEADEAVFATKETAPAPVPVQTKKPVKAEESNGYSVVPKKEEDDSDY
ncbi:hypothetical protein QBC47DRAFT_356283 [Echria macrotheca]|uniref:Uncharacterized protein n=1 Tax=Echria macrotheca TaxID=438768 RepID=A0AAJ0FFA6_9PEZI|nr:hypothetical protein QBC47DRAFT_356283 [Echria macrotheca]